MKPLRVTCKVTVLANFSPYLDCRRYLLLKKLQENQGALGGYMDSQKPCGAAQQNSAQTEIHCFLMHSQHRAKWKNLDTTREDHQKYIISTRLCLGHIFLGKAWFFMLLSIIFFSQWCIDFAVILCFYEFKRVSTWSICKICHAFHGLS